MKTLKKFIFQDGSNLLWQPYCARDVEVFLKLLKSNFKFSNLKDHHKTNTCLLYTSPSPRDRTRSRMPSSA